MRAFVSEYDSYTGTSTSLILRIETYQSEGSNFYDLVNREGKIVASLTDLKVPQQLTEDLVLVAIRP